MSVRFTSSLTSVTFEKPAEIWERNSNLGEKTQRITFQEKTILHQIIHHNTTLAQNLHMATLQLKRPISADKYLFKVNIKETGPASIGVASAPVFVDFQHVILPQDDDIFEPFQ